MTRLMSFKEDQAKKFWWLALITFLGMFASTFISNTLAADSPQLSLGDKLSVYSDKAYRKNNGRYFEAVGNVVIISQKDTVYGELASLDQETMQVKLEGNVRFITKDMTLYGSHVEYNIATGGAVIKNARITTSDYNLVANELIRVNENYYIAREAEFSTCKDCTESWSVFGKEIRMTVGQYVQIKHGLAKIKGIDVLYIPYIVLPIQTKRKSGLLFPRISFTGGEGMGMQQPVFWAIDGSQDATISPSFWAKRGYGTDLEYRTRLKPLSWVQADARLLNDQIYEPGVSGQSLSGDQFFRYFTEIETHQQWNSNLTTHMRYTGVRDLDVVRDHPQYIDPRVTSSDFGFDGFTDWRQNYFNLSVSGQYLRNQLFADPLEFDRNYVQTLPRVGLSSVPYTLIQTDKLMLKHLAVGVDGSFTRFRQVDVEEPVNLRNADRASVQPYVMWHLFNKGPVSMKTRYAFDQQMYTFAESDERDFGKNAGLMRSEVSFSMDKIFGLAYEEKIPIKYIPERDLKELREKKEQGLTPLQKSERANRLIGDLPEFESDLSKENIIQVRNSYRHSQDFKFIHHYITSQNDYGSQKFKEQITTSNQGWFDYEDALRSEEYRFGANTTVTQIPPENTMEFQWNNALIRKRPLSFNYLDDNKYLRDNFRYEKVGHFNVSQGYLLREEETVEDYRDRLTRLMVDMGYVANRWRFNLQEFYFHAASENITTLSFNRSFDYLNLLGSYNYNSFGQSNLHTASVGGQIRPTDVLGFGMLQSLDLEAKEPTMTIYNLDIMPHNNCWILNFNFTETITRSNFAFNIIWNFGQEDFKNYRNNYFAVSRF